jgi:MoxR-like ATPase
MATQNPIEQEGTYPLPEAQIDRFMLKLIVDYPKLDEEKDILKREAKTVDSKNIKAVVDAQKILQAQKFINDIYVDEKVADYVLKLVFATRDPKNYNLDDLHGLIEYGASPRASINLILVAKARAFIEHRGYVTPEDIRYMGADVLRHRIILSYEAEAEELTPEDIIKRLFETIEVP